MTQQEPGAVVFLLFLVDGTGGHDDDGPEQLLREVPVFRSRPASDVARRVESRNEHPRVVQYPPLSTASSVAAAYVPGPTRRSQPCRAQRQRSLLAAERSTSSAETMSVVRTGSPA